MLTGRGAAFGQRLRDALRRAKVSNAAAAKACNISTAAVSSWFKTGRIHKSNLRIVAGLVGMSVDELLSDVDLVQVDVAAKTEVIEVELPREAIDLARSWLVLPENERNEFRRKIETAALRYRDHVPDARMRTWGNEHAPAGKKSPKGGTQ
jgi:transcriptional regulator with XRE-family HTH domain